MKLLDASLREKTTFLCVGYNTQMHCGHLANQLRTTGVIVLYIINIS